MSAVALASLTASSENAVCGLLIKLLADLVPQSWSEVHQEIRERLNHLSETQRKLCLLDTLLPRSSAAHA